MTRASSRFTFPLGAATALVPLALVLGACGGGEKPAEAPPAPSASSAPSEAGASAPAASAFASPPPAPGETASAAGPAPAPSAGSSKVTIKTDPAWASCHQSYKANARDVSKDVAAMARGCAAVTKMKPVGKTLTGKQSDQQPPQSFPFRAKAKHCYRVYAQAAEDIKDLDLAIKDSAGAIAGEDATDDPSPVVKEDGAVCFNEDDDATVVVSVGVGTGAYAVQIWGD